MTDQFEKLRRRWASALGQNGPGWLILIALNELERDNRPVFIGALAERLQVDTTLLAIEVSKLQKKGLVRGYEKDSTRNHPVRVSLTKKSRQLISELGASPE
jgi:DNA-binding MarR family transcriptional regulator